MDERVRKGVKEGYLFCHLKASKDHGGEGCGRLPAWVRSCTCGVPCLPLGYFLASHGLTTGGLHRVLYWDRP